MSEAATPDEVIKSLSPKESAVLQLVLQLKAVDEKKQPPGHKTGLSWRHGRTTEEIIKGAEQGDLSSLPIPQGSYYDSFGWMLPRTESLRGYTGSPDIRVYDLEGSALKLFANIGSFEGMEQAWHEVIDNINYPVIADDRYGNKVENKLSAKT